MTKRLEELNDAFDREDQEVKREIGRYIHDRPGKWISKQQIVDWADIDESVVGRHIDDILEEGFIITQYDENGQLQTHWKGPGAGGLTYWLRKGVPTPLWSAGEEIRPLFTIDSLGGAYAPAVLFVVLWLIGLLTGIFGAIASFAPNDSILGISVTDAVVLAGLSTVIGSAFLLVIPLAILLDKGVHLAWERVQNWASGLDDAE